MLQKTAWAPRFIVFCLASLIFAGCMPPDEPTSQGTNSTIVAPNPIQPSPGAETSPLVPGNGEQASQRSSAVDLLKQLPPELLTSKEIAIADEIRSQKANIAGMKAQIEKTPSEGLRSGLDLMVQGLNRLQKEWQLIRRAQGKSDKIPPEFEVQ